MGGCRQINDLEGGLSMSTLTEFNSIFSGGGTISLWIKPLTIDATFGLPILKQSVSGSGWRVEIATFGTPRLSFVMNWDAGSTKGEDISPNPLTVDEWTHMALTYNSDSSSNRAQFWINGGVLSQTATGSPSSPADYANTSYQIGRGSLASASTTFRACYLQVFKGVLTQSEIRQIMYRPGSLFRTKNSIISASKKLRIYIPILGANSSEVNLTDLTRSASSALTTEIFEGPRVNPVF